MTADSDLVAVVAGRVVQTEMARRIPEWDGRSLSVPPGLPPLTLLAGRAFPAAVLERRLRFLRIMGWYPDPPPARAPVAAPGVEPPVTPEVSAEDRLAALYAAAVEGGAGEGGAGEGGAGEGGAGEGAAWADGPDGPDGAQGADPALVAVRHAWRASGTVAPPDPEAMAALTAFFDHQADAVDPGWRDRWPRRLEAASAWARVEAAALHGDRMFGRRRPGSAWRTLSGGVWRLAEFKRRRWE